MADCRKGAIDVIIPHLNYGRFLKECLSSIRAQGVDANVTLVDAGSTDSTFEVLREFPEVRILSFKSDVRDAFVYGFNHTSADYVVFFSSDNVMLPEFLKSAKKALDANPEAGLAYGYAHEVGEDGVRTGRDLHGGAYSRSRLAINNFIDSSEGVFRRSAWSGTYPSWLVCHPDWAIWLEICERWKAVNLDRPVVLFRVHGSTFSNRRRAEIDAEAAVIRRKNSEGFPFRPATNSHGDVLHAAQN